MQIPIVIAAFGTTTAAWRSYTFLDEHLRAAFPEHEIHWAFSSRIVRDFSRQGSGRQAKGPAEILEELQARGFEWAVVQSLHLLAGHEFYRLVEEVQACRMRTAMGLPLLWAPADYRSFVEALAARLNAVGNGDGIILVGHGTDHPSWATYPALQYLLASQFGNQVYIGVLQGQPSRKEVVAEVVRSGRRRIRLLPLMLVAGRHLQKELAGPQDSWKASLEEAGLTVTLDATGLLHYPEVIKIFQDHIGNALEVILGRDQSNNFESFSPELTYQASCRIIHPGT